MLKEMREYRIGNTSLVRVPDVHGNQIYLKMEKENYLGSVKARTAYWMIRGLPTEIIGHRVIESSSGNLGLALGFFCREVGLDFLCLVDSSMPEEKRKRLEKFEIQYVCVDKEEGFDFRQSRIRMAERMMESGEGYWINQYDNPEGVKAHELTTGPEIWEQTDGRVTHCVCPIGSGGTVCGTGRFLKRQSSSVRICGVEPYGSTIYSTYCGSYINAGAGLRGMPGNLIHNLSTVDFSYAIEDRESIYYANQLMKQYQLPVGITTGMAFAGAMRIAEETEGKTIVVISPDGREGYEEFLSREAF